MPVVSEADNLTRKPSAWYRRHKQTEISIEGKSIAFHYLVDFSILDAIFFEWLKRIEGKGLIDQEIDLLWEIDHTVSLNNGKMLRKKN